MTLMMMINQMTRTVTMTMVTDSPRSKKEKTLLSIASGNQKSESIFLYYRSHSPIQ